MRLGAHGWELHAGSRCVACEPYAGLRDRVFARVFVQRFLSDPMAMGAIREVLRLELPPWTMIRVFNVGTTELMTDLLARGLWHVHAPARMEDQGGGQAEAEEPDIAEIEQAPAASTSNDPVRRPAPPPEEGSLPRNADEAAIVASLKLASEQGIPFCEECAKAALKRAQGAAVA
jgi:hypothetical protein